MTKEGDHATHKYYNGKENALTKSLMSRILSMLCDNIIIDQFRYIQIQSQTMDFRARLWGINPTNSVFIPQSLVLRSIVWGWILIYRNWPNDTFLLSSSAKLNDNVKSLNCALSGEREPRGWIINITIWKCDLFFFFIYCIQRGVLIKLADRHP